MDFVNEEDNLAVALSDLIDDSLQSLLKLTFILRTCHESAHIERINLFRFKILRHIPAHDTVGKSLGDSRFAGAWFAYEHRVVFGSA